MYEQLFVNYETRVMKRDLLETEDYLRSLRKVSQFLYVAKIKKDSIYDIDSLRELDYLYSKLIENSDFMKANIESGSKYLDAVEVYSTFCKGSLLEKYDIDPSILDCRCPIKEESEFSIIPSQVYDKINVNQVLKLAHYKCDVDDEHETPNYLDTVHALMEAHYLVPISMQSCVANSLDVYANILCICPSCHLHLHTGSKDEVRDMLEKIYNERADRLKISGIAKDKETFWNLIEKSGEYF